MEWVALGSLLLLAATVFVLWQSRSKAGASDQALSLMQQQMDAMRRQLDERLGAVTQQMLESNRTIGDRLEGATKVVSDVQRGLGELSKANERIFEVGKDISSLQELLRSPKLRGGLGELLLGDLLAQILPETHYTLQHTFRTRETVDAVIRLAGGLVPVDAKFPLENFRRMVECATDEEKRPWQRRFRADVRGHVDAIAAKYILPDEGTFDFALMYIPAENVYYETIIRDEAAGEDKGCSSYALERRVIPVSPHTFYAYLRAIVLGLRGLRIEENAREIVANLGRLRGDFARFQEEFRVLGNHLTAAGKKYGDAERRLDRFDTKLQAVEAQGAIEGTQEDRRVSEG